MTEFDQSRWVRPEFARQAGGEGVRTFKDTKT